MQACVHLGSSSSSCVFASLRVSYSSSSKRIAAAAAPLEASGSRRGALAPRRRCSSGAAASSSTTGDAIDSDKGAERLSPDRRVGVVVVDHGSKREASNAMLGEFVELYRCVHGDLRMCARVCACACV